MSGGTGLIDGELPPQGRVSCDTHALLGAPFRAGCPSRAAPRRSERQPRSCAPEFTSPGRLPSRSSHTCIPGASAWASADRAPGSPPARRRKTPSPCAAAGPAHARPPARRRRQPFHGSHSPRPRVTRNSSAAPHIKLGPQTGNRGGPAGTTAGHPHAPAATAPRAAATQAQATNAGCALTAAGRRPLPGTSRARRPRRPRSPAARARRLRPDARAARAALTALVRRPGRLQITARDGATRQTQQQSSNGEGTRGTRPRPTQAPNPPTRVRPFARFSQCHT